MASKMASSENEDFVEDDPKRTSNLVTVTSQADPETSVLSDPGHPAKSERQQQEIEKRKKHDEKTRSESEERKSSASRASSWH
jgi:2-methylcitrate dehydratase PrpD